MKIIQIGAGDLKELSVNRKIIAFGAGKILRNTMERFELYSFEDDIQYIVDNNSAVWETEITIHNKNIRVHSPEYMLEHISNEIIVIMVKAYEEILAQLNGYKKLNKKEIYLYPNCIFTDQDQIENYGKGQPLTETVLTFGEGDTHENALALFEYFKENDLLGRYKWVWLCSNPEKNMSTENVKYIKREILKGAPTRTEANEWSYYLNTAKYLFFENRMLSKKQKDQISVYLKHGTFMLKNVKGKINIPDEVYGAICTSHNYADLASDQESIDKSKLIFCGSPRLDFLYKEKHVLETIGCYISGKKYILWLPTMRQTVGLSRNDVGKIAPFGIPLMQSDADFERLDNRLEELNCKLVIKPHPHQDLSVYKIGEYRNIIFVPQAELDAHDFPIHSLMRECDALISDYSSVAFDYMLLDRPIAYTVDDMDDYQIGFSVDDPLHYMPGEKLQKAEDMLTFLEHVVEGKDLFAAQRREIRDYVHEYQDDKNCERFLKIMKMI